MYKSVCVVNEGFHCHRLDKMLDQATELCRYCKQQDRQTTAGGKIIIKLSVKPSQEQLAICLF